MKKLIGLVFSVLASYATFSQDISGNAGSATLWGGGISDLNNFLNGNLSTPGNLAALMGLESNTGYWKKISRVQVNAFLGIPADGETLQSVTDRGNITYKKIVLAKDADQLRLQSSGLVNYTDILSGNDGFQITHGSSGNPALHIVHASGNVGIGTAVPAFKLDVNGETNISTNAYIHYMPFDIKMKVGADGLQCYNYSMTTLKNLFLNPAGGNVGIGTTLPSQKLEVAGKILANANDGGFQAKRGGNHNEFLTGENGELAFYQSTSGGFPIWVKENANVGIGTTSPRNKLDILGDARSYEAAFGCFDAFTSCRGYANFGSNNHGSVLLSTNLFMSGNDNLKIVNTHPTMSGAAVLIPGNGQPNQNGIVFYTKEPGSAVADAAYEAIPRMLITSAGDVGIGTIHPQSKFSVNGTITSTKVKVTQEGWADYVFDSSYCLAPLNQVEKFILANKHLPEVPSADEVKKEGLDVGGNQALLLKKIEELTLYIIQQNKELTQQNREIIDLKQRMAGMEARQSKW